MAGTPLRGICWCGLWSLSTGNCTRQHAWRPFFCYGRSELIDNMSRSNLPENPAIIGLSGQKCLRINGWPTIGKDGGTMSIIVPKEILDRTTKCPHAFSCLDSGKCGEREMCIVDQADGEDVLLLKSKEAASCTYRIPFGVGQLCTCPTHFYINSQQK